MLSCSAQIDAEDSCLMSRYILVIGDRRLAVFDAPNFDRANSLKNSADLAATLKDTCSDGAPLWDGSEPINFQLPEPHEEDNGRRNCKQKGPRATLRTRACSSGLYPFSLLTAATPTLGS